MKKIISIVLILTVLCLSTIGVYAKGTDTSTKIHYNGKYITFATKPTTAAGKVSAPLKELGSKIGIAISYDAKTKCYTAKKDAITAVVNTAKKNMAVIKGGKTSIINLGADLKVLKSDIMVPVKVVGDSFNIETVIDAKSNTAIMLDMSNFENMVKTKAPTFYQFITTKYAKAESAEMKGSYSGSIYVQDYIDEQATTLDIKGDIGLNAKYNNNTYSINGQVKLSGLEELMETDELNNIDFQIIVDNDTIYLKTNLFSTLGMELEDKWGRMFIKDLGIDGINTLEDLKKYEDPQKGYNLNEIAGETAGTLTVDSYKSIYDIFTPVISLIDEDNFKATKTDASTLTYTWTITKNDIIKISLDSLIKNAGQRLGNGNLSLGDIKEIKDFLAKTEFKFNSKMVIVNNIMTSTEFNLDFQFDSEDIGQIKASFKGASNLTNINNKTIKVEIPTEEQVIDLNEVEIQ